MRITRVKVASFKNLQDFEIHLDENAAVSVLVGRNGSGKSNLLEALTIIFRDIDLGRRPDFVFELVSHQRKCGFHLLEAVANWAQR